MNAGTDVRPDCAAAKELLPRLATWANIVGRYAARSIPKEFARSKSIRGIDHPASGVQVQPLLQIGGGAKVEEGVGQFVRLINA